MLHRRPLLLPLLLIACTERPIGGDTDTSTSNATTSGTDATTTTPVTTATVTTAAPTTGPVATVTTDAPPGGSTSGVKLDVLPDMPPATGLVGCTLAAPAGTLVEGASGLGPFLADRAYFGAVKFDVPHAPMLLFVSPGADPAIEVEQTNGSSGPVLHGDVSTDALAEGGWIGTWPYFGQVLADGQVDFPGGLDVTIDARAGNWDVPDPQDPPRLLGTLSGPIAGPFDAVYCDALDQQVIVE